MHVAVTGATGFIGRYIIRHLLSEGHSIRAWYRDASRQFGIDNDRLTWVAGHLNDNSCAIELVSGCDAVIHAGLYRPGKTFRGGEGDLVEFVQTNVLGTLQLIEAARSADVGRFVFISTCAVHEKILEDRPLDEAHPLWASTHYGAHKAAIEKFVHSYGMGFDYPVCALRPTGVYGVADPVQNSKWFSLVQSVVRGDPVTCRRGGKEVHAADVAAASVLLLTAKDITGEAFNCYDRYVSEFDVATIAKELSGSQSQIDGEPKQPKHQIETGKLKSRGMSFGGDELLRTTIQQMIDACG